MMNENERREAEFRSIMKIFGGQPKEEKKPAPKKQTEKKKEGAKK